MKRYEVTAQVTISIHGYVHAEDLAGAMEAAEGLELPTIHEDHNHDPAEWRTSGELDGLPKAIEVVGLADEDEPC